MKLNIDTRKLNRIIKDNPDTFTYADPLKVLTLRSDLEDYIYDVRVQTLVGTGVKRSKAEAMITEFLEKSESNEVL